MDASPLSCVRGMRTYMSLRIHPSIQPTTHQSSPHAQSHTHTPSSTCPTPHTNSFARFDSLAYARTAVVVPSPTTTTKRAPARRVVRLVFSMKKSVDLTEMSWPLLAFHAPRGARGVTLGRCVWSVYRRWRRFVPLAVCPSVVVHLWCCDTHFLTNQFPSLSSIPSAV